MAATSLTRTIPPEKVASEEVSAAKPEVRAGVHDASRVEWIVSLPLAATEQEFTTEVVIEIPSNLFAKHAPWDQLQELARLDGREEGAAFDTTTVDGLRRSAVTLASQLTRAGDALVRHCRLISKHIGKPAEDSSVVLGSLKWLQTAVLLVDRTRTRLSLGAADARIEIVKERALVDEYLSVRLLEVLSGAERELEALGESPLANELEEACACALERELEFRASRGFIEASGDSPRQLERYLDRSSKLKKHFQEVLFLTAERYAVSQRLHHVAAALAGIVAAMGAFVMQIVLLKQATASTTAVTGGFVLLTVVAGVSYAVRDRAKDVGLHWMTGRMHRLYAQRVVRWRLPRMETGPSVVIHARESIDEELRNDPDPLNPESGAKTSSTHLRFKQRATVESSGSLVETGITRVRQVFRYDMSPIFSRLDDATKPVPVLDVRAHRVRTAHAPRCYRFPMTVTVTSRSGVIEERGTLVVDKRGLDRFEPNE